MTALFNFLADRNTRLVLAWLLLAGAIAQRGYAAWVNFEVPDRPFKNDGHTSIDFGGQWMMGRLLVLGHGRNLYSRETHRRVANESYPRADEPAHQTERDGDKLVACYVGPADDPVGGPLYPPVHAFVMAPVALISDPYNAYRTTQVLLFGCLALAGLGVRYLTRGRWWWVTAAAFLLLYPGNRGGLDLAQNCGVTLTLLIWGWAFLVRGRPALGGFVLGLLAFKPVWAVSFLVALIVLQHWRAAFAMAATGAAAVLLTVPVVGVQVWFDWLHVGGLAAAEYNVDQNWIFLSRDLFGIPRRIMLDFEGGKAVNDRPSVALVGWALWLFVAGVTALVAWRRRTADRLTGPLPALVLLAAWMCCYRFMYYDAAVAAIGVVVLFADPRPYFRRAWWPARSWAAGFVGLMLVFENLTVPLNVEMTASVMALRKKETAPDGTTTVKAPTIYLASGDNYPWDTVAVFLLWAWCAVTLVRTPAPNRLRNKSE
ncbi:MAG TPA: glycosyltransferase family 87 protein [Gemmataceae bacterium]|nr:glycosyltransferase family 87 protein [Gemmataceae bacterium]